MYFVDEDGHQKPAPEALLALDTIVMFHSSSWFMAVVDMFFKVHVVQCCVYEY